MGKSKRSSNVIFTTTSLHDTTLVHIGNRFTCPSGYSKGQEHGLWRGRERRERLAHIAHIRMGKEPRRAPQDGKEQGGNIPPPFNPQEAETTRTERLPLWFCSGELEGPHPEGFQGERGSEVKPPWTSPIRSLSQAYPAELER